ncbi:MAG: hypothetical protein ACYTGZ_10335 [Planctomycetota bacterium]|jgi:hypothetical protein
MADTNVSDSPMRYVWQFAFGAWCILFVLGVVGELLGVGWLQSLTDVKQLFLK